MICNYVQEIASQLIDPSLTDAAGGRGPAIREDRRLKPNTAERGNCVR